MDRQSDKQMNHVECTDKQIENFKLQINFTFKNILYNINQQTKAEKKTLKKYIAVNWQSFIIILRI